MPLPDGPVTLIVNPAAGSASRLGGQWPSLTRLLSEAGHEAHLVETTDGPDTAATLARQAVAAGSGTVLACGGDGTVHGVVQGLAGSPTALGVLPLGTHNALARSMGLSADPAAALRQILWFEPVRVPLGQCSTPPHTRWFLVMSGCGPDGALVHALSDETASRFKRRYGALAYPLAAVRLMLTRRWPAFEVSWRDPQTGTWEQRRVAGALVPRIPDLGGFFSGLTSSAELQSPVLHLHLLSAPAALSFPAWMTLTRVGLPHPLLSVLEASEVRCAAPVRGAVCAQADGEPLGEIPLTLRLVPDALTLMLPQHADVR